MLSQIKKVNAHDGRSWSKYKFLWPLVHFVFQTCELYLHWHLNLSPLKVNSKRQMTLLDFI